MNKLMATLQNLMCAFTWIKHTLLTVVMVHWLKEISRQISYKKFSNNFVITKL